jgi:hypothetical protein
MYVLELEKNKYYIGKTNNRHFNLQEAIIQSTHFSWTNIYKPLTVLSVTPTYMNPDEEVNSLTLIYMRTFGIHHVRGGSLSSIELNLNELRRLDELHHIYSESESEYDSEAEEILENFMWD